jgi:hypothetical protein
VSGDWDAATMLGKVQTSGLRCMALHVRTVPLQLSSPLPACCPGYAATPLRSPEPRLSPSSWLRLSRVRRSAASTCLHEVCSRAATDTAVVAAAMTLVNAAAGERFARRRRNRKATIADIAAVGAPACLDIQAAHALARTGARLAAFTCRTSCALYVPATSGFHLLCQ